MEQLTKYATEIVDLLKKILLAVTPSKEKWTNVYESAVLVHTGDVVTTLPSVLHGYHLYNNNAAIRSVKIFDKGSLPAMGSDKPKVNIVVAPNSAAQIWMPRGVHFAYGIAVSVTTGLGDYNNGAPTAGDVVVNLYYE